MQRKNCYIFGSCLRMSSKGLRLKTSSKAFRKQIAEVSMPCSFPPSPPTPLHPRRGDEVSSTALCGQRCVRGGVHAQRPTFKLVGNHVSLAHAAAAFVHFEGWQSTMNSTPSKTRPHRAVEGRFEGWRLTVNSSTSNTRPHRAVELPFSPGGAREGWGESGGCSVRIATSLIAACACRTRAGGPKTMQRPFGNRLQKLHRLVHSPPLPQPLSTPAGAERGAQQPYVANALSGVAFTCRRQHSNLPGTACAGNPIDAVCVHFEGWRLTVNSPP